jgi:two-component system, OmpR family, copper resistance phosphate regulon response regulator CusR
MRTLVIEDESRMRELLRMGLYERGFSVMTADDGETGLQIAASTEFDSIVLDIGLPGLDGYALMQALRAHGSITPVLMLTARDTENDIIRGLEAGADDYLTKPFSFPELVARLQSITRRQRQGGNGTIKTADVEIDVMRRAVMRGGDRIDLTRLEFRLLESLLRRAGQCVSRRGLMEVLWGVNHKVGASALDVLVKSLRSKIDEPYRRKLIGTVRGIGYILHESTDTPGGKP